MVVLTGGSGLYIDAYVMVLTMIYLLGMI